MAADITRLLIFRSKDVGKDLVFVLTFENEGFPGVPRNPEKDKDKFSTAFKVSTFGATGSYTFRVLYNSKIGVARVQLPGEIVVPASTYTPIHAGQKTTLTKMGSPPLYSFSEPTSNSLVDQMVVLNGTSSRETIGFGLLDRLDREIPQMISQIDVDPNVEVKFQFSPILKGYMTWDFQDSNGIMSGSVRSNILFNEDLSKLDPVTNWRVTYNKESDTYVVSPESPDNVAEDEI